MALLGERLYVDILVFHLESLNVKLKMLQYIRNEPNFSHLP